VKRILPLLFIVLIVLLFFWKVWLKGLVPFPGDLLVGAYYPWLEYKWGFEVGVPVKNALISDVFSQMYIWKHLVLDSLKLGQWPLWNPYSYSGYPLLANFSSGALYPLNLLLFLGEGGWSMMAMLQIVGSGLAMYWFLRERKFSSKASVAGAISFAFSSAMMVRMEWNSAGHVMLWLATIMAIIETYFEKNRKIIVLLPPAIFLTVTSGHFQTMLYGFALISSYVIYKLIKSANLKRLFEIGLFVILGTLMASVQLLPTAVMMSKSVRFVEEAIARDNYGLLPVRNLITMLAPDFFGNPTTGNYSGVLNYSETIFYPGIVGLVSLLWAGTNFRKLNAFLKFFLVASLISIIMAFNNPIGRLVYELKVPILSTGYAARISIVLIFATSVLTASWLSRVSKMKTKEAVLPILTLILAVVMCFILIRFSPSILFLPIVDTAKWLEQVSVAIRNLILPSILIIGLFGLVVFRKIKWVKYLIILIIIADLFRFGWKYNPFVNKQWIYPNTEVTDFLTSQPGLFRVEAQAGRPVLPANTWAMYGLYSASGYDPLANRSYAYQYSKLLNDSETVTRYSLLGKYDNSDSLGEFNVKYFLAERDNLKAAEVVLNDWEEVLETEKIKIFLNPDFKERIEWRGDGEGEVKVEKYSANLIELNYVSTTDGEIVIRDSWDEGWKTWVNGDRQETGRYLKIFRKTKVPAGKGNVVMEYKPDEWEFGGKITIIGFVSWFLVGLYIIRRYNA